MSFWVYILRCADGSYYTGHTDNLEQRIGQHHAGTFVTCYTFKRRPLQFVFSQDCTTREEALTAEQQIKGWSRKKKEAMMRGDWAEVSRLAKSKNLTSTIQSVRPELVEGQQLPPTVSPEPVEGPLSSAHGSTSSPRTEDAETQATPAVRPEPVEGPPPSAHGSTSSPRTEDAESQATPAVRPEPVEGPLSSAHGSTSSPRTEDEESQATPAVRPESVEGSPPSAHGSTSSPRTEDKESQATPAVRPESVEGSPPSAHGSTSSPRTEDKVFR